ETLYSRFGSRAVPRCSRKTGAFQRRSPMRRPAEFGQSPALMERLESRVQFPAGALNTAVNLTGIVKKSFRTTNDFIDTVAQAGGKIVCVGDVQASGQTKDVVVARFNA